MNNISYISNLHEIKLYAQNLDLEFDNILRSCGIRSRSQSNQQDSSDTIPISDSFNNTNNSKIENKEMEQYCSESSNFPNIPFGSTPPDTNRIRDLYKQYISQFELDKKDIEKVE
jgi:hypothetical protein